MKSALSAFAAVFLLSLAACSTADGGGPGYGPGAGWGSGMMGRYGPGYGMGPGMMRGAEDGYGMMGPGMMGGYGPGMMGGYLGNIPDMTADQRTKVGEIQRDLRRKQWALMQQMHELMWGDGTAGSGAFDEQAARKNFDATTALRKQMFENGLEARKRIDAVLTPQQREQLRRGAPAR